MKFSKLAMGAALALAYGNAYAFHSGGVAECDGCHTMHNSDGGVAMTDYRPQYSAGPYLLQGNQSEACLNCHQNSDPVKFDTAPSGYHISTPDFAMLPAGDPANTLAVPRQMTPGGDFGWIRKDVPFAVRGTPMTNIGEDRGHNIVAPGYGYEDDKVLTTAPGGSFVSANLACSSCHDPHGKYRIMDLTAMDVQVTTGAPIGGSSSYGAAAKPGTVNGVYRILGGSGYAPKSYNAGAFTAPAPAATVASGYNRSEALTETIVAYGKGMSEYCANCHPSMLSNGYVSGTDMLVHPAGNSAPLGTTIAANYKAYVKSGDLSNTTGPSFTSLVPFELGSANYATINTARTQVGGPVVDGATSTVSCLSCHRAHASGFKSMLRYAHMNEFMTIGDAAGLAMFDTSTTEGKINQGFASVAAQETQYYGRPATKFAPYQRLLCNKCHAKD